MSNPTANNHHFDDFIADFGDQPQTIPRDVDSASAGNHGPSQQQFLVDDFEDKVVVGKGPQEPKFSSNQAADLLGDFLSRERGDPPAPPTFDVKAEINSQNLIDNLPSQKGGGGDIKDDDDFGQIQPDYLNPYASSKLESNEKFISTDDLIGLSDNEGKDNATFEDCDKEDELPKPFDADAIKEPEPVIAFVKPVEPVKTEIVAAKVEPPPSPPSVKPEPKVEPVKPVEPPPKETPKPAQETVVKKPVEPLEAEKLFKRFGLGESFFFVSFLYCKIDRSLTYSPWIFFHGLFTFD